jgi:hypothetical protein
VLAPFMEHEVLGQS